MSAAACVVAPVCGAACAVRSGAPARRSPDRRADERSSAAPARQHTRRSRAPPRRVFASARRSRRAALVDGTAPHPGRVRAVRSCARRKHVFPGDFFVTAGAAAMRGNAAAARGVGGTRAGVDRRALARACASRAADSHEGERAGAERQKKGSRSFAQIGLCDAKSDRASGRNFFFLRRPPNASSQCATDAMRACENLRRDFVECAETRARLGFQRDRKKTSTHDPDSRMDLSRAPTTRSGRRRGGTAGRKNRRGC